MMAIGINAISEKATKRRIFDVCNSTMEMSSRAPHHEFWPNVCEQIIVNIKLSSYSAHKVKVSTHV